MGCADDSNPCVYLGGRVMAAKRGTGKTTKAPVGDLMRRLQGMLYEYHALGSFDEARPHILWLMEIAEAQASNPQEPRHIS